MIKTANSITNKFWDIHQKTLLNKHQKKVISKMFEAGPAGFQDGISAKKYTSMTKCSKATATRDLTELRKKSILIETGTGRSTKYDLNIYNKKIIRKVYFRFINKNLMIESFSSSQGRLNFSN